MTTRVTGRVVKPKLAREGANVSIYRPGDAPAVIGEDQGYGKEGSIVQELCEPPRFYRREEKRWVYAVIGLWMIDGVPSGMTVRESGGPITDNFSNFIPHVYVRLIRRIERMRRTPQTVEA